MSTVPLRLRIPSVDPAWPASLVLAGSMFSGNAAYLGLPFSPDRLALVALLAVLALATPVAAGRPLRLGSTTAVLLGAAVLWTTMSALWTGTLGDREALFAILDRIGLVPFVLFALAPRLFATARQREILLRVVVACGAYLGALAILKGLGLNALAFPRYIANDALGYQPDRARGPFIESVANGMALFECAVVALIAVRGWNGWPRRAALATAAACTIGIVFTLTRSVWIGGAAGALIALLCSASTRRLVVPALLGGVALVLVLLAVVPGLSGSASARGDYDLSVYDRLNSNHAAVRMVDAKPLFGWGWYAFPTRSPPWFEQAEDRPLTGVGILVHNSFLGNAVELGLLGTAVWLAAWFAALGPALRPRGRPEIEPWRLALVAVVVNWVVVAQFAPVNYAFPILLLFVVAGAVTAPERAGLARPRPEAVRVRAPLLGWGTA